MKALIVCKESISSSSHKFIDVFSRKGVQGFMFYTEPFEVIVKHPMHEKYSELLRVDFCSIFPDGEAKSIINGYLDSLNDPYLPRNFSKSELNSITEYLNLYPGLITDINKRRYFKDINKTHVLAYFDMLAEYYDKAINKLKPNLVFDVYPENISRIVLDVVLKRHGIKYICLFHSRYKDYMFLSTSVTRPGEELFERVHKSITSKYLLKANHEINNYKKSLNLLNDDEKQYEKNIHSFSFYKALKLIIGTTLFTSFSKVKRIDKNWYPRKTDRAFIRVIADTSFRVIVYNSYITFVKYIRLRKKYHTPDFSEFYYFPLSYTAEGDSFLTRGPWFSDLDSINTLRHYLPFGTSLVMKEHRSMIGERTSSEINWMNKIPSLKYIPASDINYSNPLKLLNESIGTITLAGTSGLESLLLGKPTLILGNPIYQQYMKLPSVYDDGFKVVESFFKSPDDYCADSDSISSYIAALLRDGIKISYSNLLTYNGGNVGNEVFELICDKVIEVYNI